MTPTDVTAKFRCTNIKDNPNGKTVSFTAATGPGNEAWAGATPAGHLEMAIENPGAAEHFQDGAEYILTFQRA